jgi:acyl-CoA hydrolase
VHEVSAEHLQARLTGYADRTPRVVVSGNHATPYTALGLLDQVLPQYRLVTLNAQRGVPDREGVTHETPFVGPGVRHSPRLVYLPARLSLVPRMFATSLQPDIVLLHTTTPRDGRVSLGSEVNILPAAVEQTRLRGGLVVAQVDRHMPWTYGDAELGTDLIDLALSADEGLPAPQLVPPSDTSAAIAERVAALVDDGATLQAGIGGIPDADNASLRSRRGLRFWTEMFSDGVLGLDRAGALDPDGVLTASFVFGSAELMAWLDGNPRVRMLRTEKANDPALIAGQRKMTSINSALQVDLFGQANASWVKGRIYSGLGGQSDFVVGALHSVGGQAIMALPSWHEKAGCSTVVARLDGPTTSFQHSWIVSDQGQAAIWPQDQRTQARQLLDVAHPSAREALRAAGRDLGVLP